MRTNTITDFITRVVVRSFILMSVVTVCLLAPRVMATDEAMAAPTCEAGSHQVAGQCTPDQAPDTAPIASTLDYATESVLIVEGQNPDTTPVVEVTFPNGAQIWIPEEDPSGGHLAWPTPIWLDNSPLYSGGWLLQVNDVTGVTRWLDVHERLTITEQDEPTTDAAPVQTVAHIANANPYGAGAGAKCGTDAQCAAYSRSIGEAPSGYAALSAPAPHRFTAEERKAARLILARLQSHRPIFEDWTWAGAPRVVGAHNDALSLAAEGAGLHGKSWPWSSKARTWLSQVVRTGKG